MEEKSRNFRNILNLSISIMLLNGGYFTIAGISQAILESAKIDDPSITVNGYISLAINYAIFSITNFFAPTAVAFIGVRTALVLGSIAYTLYTFSYIWSNVTVYIASAMLGIFSAIFYVAHGCYLTRNCTNDNIGKYLGIYWTIMSLGQLTGNSFIFWGFQGANHIKYETRILVISVLTTIGIMSSVSLMFLGTPSSRRESELEDETPDLKLPNPKEAKGFISSLSDTFRLFKNKHMLLLIPPSICNGFEMAYFEAILPTTVGFTEAFGGDVRKWVGLSGILIGLGSLCGGLIFGAFGEKLVKSNRSVIMIIACLSLCLFCVLVYLNHPDPSSLRPTLDVSWINPPLVPISLFCAFLLGLGDGCMNTQINAAIGVMWPQNPLGAHAIFRLFQGSSCALALCLATVAGQKNQLIIFVGLCLVGTITFVVNESLIEKRFQHVRRHSVIKHVPIPFVKSV